jgi:hypothetical protein
MLKKNRHSNNLKFVFAVPTFTGISFSIVIKMIPDAAKIVCKDKYVEVQITTGKFLPYAIVMLQLTP